MQIALLGPREVRDGTGSPRGQRHQRPALLIRLALRAGQFVPAGTLIDELWGGRLPADAPTALQARVSRLRRADGEPALIAGGASLCRSWSPSWTGCWPPTRSGRHSPGR